MNWYSAEGKCLKLYLMRKTNNGKVKVFLGESAKNIKEAFSQLVHKIKHFCLWIEDLEVLWLH